MITVGVGLTRGPDTALLVSSAMQAVRRGESSAWIVFWLKWALESAQRDAAVTARAVA